MLRMSAFIGAGYALGPLLGLVCELVVNAAGWKDSVTNSNTTPGWLMVILFACEAVFLLTHFNDEAATMYPTSKAKKNPAGAAGGAGGAGAGGAAAAPPIPWARIAPFYVVVFLIPINVGSWEVNTVFFATMDFGRPVL